MHTIALLLPPCCAKLLSRYLNFLQVVRHHETFLAGNKLCIVMEFAPAGDLAGFIKAAVAGRRALPEATIWQIFLQLCQGMQVGWRMR